jgi:hypothetical protein
MAQPRDVVSGDHRIQQTTTRLQPNEEPSRLLRLPAELRIHIWTYAVQHNEPCNLTPSSGHFTIRTSLLSCCELVREETTGNSGSTNTLMMTVFTFNIGKVMERMQPFGHKKNSSIAEIAILFDNTSLRTPAASVKIDVDVQAYDRSTTGVAKFGRAFARVLRAAGVSATAMAAGGCVAVGGKWKKGECGPSSRQLGNQGCAIEFHHAVQDIVRPGG